MNWYFAARTKQRDFLIEVSKSLEQNGHKVIYQWFNLPNLEPYNEHEFECKNIAQKMAQAIQRSDIFVLISDAGGTDMFIELGIALQSFVQKKSPKIYAVGNFNKRSLLLVHPVINHLDSFDDRFKIECPEISFHDY